ncbi:universal stress protein [Roseococcus sp. YIM B11640]|uniref:universal stress protein n=1 Tax=Roseococcus sp. YIM B11640 TaxID=3133973 RepID=UPI003C7BFFDE
MLRTLLLALDDTPGAIAARDLAFALARRAGAKVTAVVALDRPHTTGSYEAIPLGGAAFAARRNEARAAALEAEAATVIAAAREAAGGDLSFTIVRREEEPAEALLAEGAAQDLLVIGRDSTLGTERTEDGLSPSIGTLVRDGARPLLVVPPGPLPAPGAPILVGYDGSLPAMRTIQLFATLGIGTGHQVKLVDFSEAPRPEALQAYLAAHGLDVACFPAEGELDDLLLAEARGLGAGMIVLGADDAHGVARLIFGSPVARLLRAAACPVFIHG